MFVPKSQIQVLFVSLFASQTIYCRSLRVLTSTPVSLSPFLIGHSQLFLSCIILLLFCLHTFFFWQIYFLKFIKMDAILFTLWVRLWNPEPDCLNLNPNLIVNHLEWFLGCSAEQALVNKCYWCCFLASVSPTQFKFLLIEIHLWVVISSRIWEYETISVILYLEIFLIHPYVTLR